MKPRSLRLLVALVLTLAPAGGLALADVFTIDDTDVEKGKHGVELNSAFQSGFPVNADPIHHSWEALYNYGATDWWLFSTKVNLDKPDGADFQASTVGMESMFKLGEIGDEVALGLQTEVDFGVHRGETNTAVLGPIIEFGDEKLSLILNPYLEKTFGNYRTPGVDFTYAWQLKTLLREGFAVGIEGYGAIPDIANAPGIDFQEHRVGPVVYVERALKGRGPDAAMHAGSNGAGADAGDAKDEGPIFAFEAGVLFGLTEATPDVTAKVNAELQF